MDLHEARRVIGKRAQDWQPRQLGEAARARLALVGGRTSAALWTLALYGEPNEFAQVNILVEWVVGDDNAKRRWASQASELRAVCELDNRVSEDVVLNALESSPFATLRALVNSVLSETAIPVISIEQPAQDAIAAWSRARAAERGYGDRAFDADAQVRLPYPAIDPMAVLEAGRVGAEAALRAIVTPLVAGRRDDSEVPAAVVEAADAISASVPPSSGARLVELRRRIDEAHALVVSHPTTREEWENLEAKLSAALDAVRAELAGL